MKIMKCPKCGNEFNIKLASKVICQGCSMITALTTVLTLQCDKCKHVFQFPVPGNSVFSVKKDEE